MSLLKRKGRFKHTFKPKHLNETEFFRKNDVFGGEIYTLIHKKLQFTYLQIYKYFQFTN